MASTTTIGRIARKLLSKPNFVLIHRNSSLWTSDLVVNSPFKELDVPNVTLADYVWENLGRWPDKTATICGITGQQYTYHEMYKYSRNLATRLRNIFKIRDGDVICVMLPNMPEFPLAVFGCIQAGAVITTVNPIYTAHEVSRQLIHSKAKLIISSSECVSVIREAMKITKTDLPIICAGNAVISSGIVSLKQLIEDDLLDCSVLGEVNKNPEDICFLPYSSGTTGMPKGVELTHNNIVANCCQLNEPQIQHVTETTNYYQDQVLGILPFFHIYGLTILMIHKLAAGVKLVTLPKFQSNTFLKAMEDHQLSLLYAAPPIILFLANHPEVTADHLAHLKVVMCAAAPVPQADVKKFFTKVQRNLDFVQGYGLTETSPLVTLMPRQTDNYVSVGYAVAKTQMKIVDSESRVLGPNEVGELLVKGPQVMKGYRDNLEATLNAIDEDGWFKTGDLSSIDNDGFLYIHDRLKELIKVKGFQVPPAELEGVLKEHPDILDAAVVAIPHKRFGEVPKAFVVVKDGHTIKSDDVVEFVSKRVAEYKRIHDVVFLEALPKNPSGKILRRVLKEKYC